MASSLLEGRALTWWRTECAYDPTLLTYLDFDDFVLRLEDAFIDVDLVHKLRSKLNSIRQITTV